jgi:hypothetical protein
MAHELFVYFLRSRISVLVSLREQVVICHPLCASRSPARLQPVLDSRVPATPDAWPTSNEGSGKGKTAKKPPRLPLRLFFAQHMGKKIVQIGIPRSKIAAEVQKERGTWKNAAFLYCRLRACPRGPWLLNLLGITTASFDLKSV